MSKWCFSSYLDGTATWNVRQDERDCFSTSQSIYLLKLMTVMEAYLKPSDKSKLSCTLSFQY